MGRRSRWGASIGAGTLALAAVLAIPDPNPELMPHPDRAPFVWGQDALFERLEREFDRARERGCEAETPRIDEGLEGLDAALARVDSAPHAPTAPVFVELEEELFALAPRLGACLSRTPELTERVARLRRAVKDQSRDWDVQADRASRDRLYRLLYGSRAVLEELLLQMDDPPGLMLGVDEPSEAPSVSERGVTLRSGDILASRGGAPTSALIARGNDYPGNFSHIALLHIAEDGTPTVIESHIESGVGAFPISRYLEDTKLRIMVLRLRADHPAVTSDPGFSHRVATAALERARGAHVPYDFAMDPSDRSALFCSEVASAAYAAEGVTLWRGLSSMSSEGLTRWLSRIGVEHFETHSPSDLEYDPQVRVVAEWRDPETLFDDHLDNAVIDVMLEGAEEGDELGYAATRLPIARIAKAYSVVLNVFGALGPVPEGMSATTALRVEYLREHHRVIREGLEERVVAYREEHGRRPPYWDLVRLARAAKADGARRDGA